MNWDEDEEPELYTEAKVKELICALTHLGEEEWTRCRYCKDPLIEAAQQVADGG